jgi:hypothetical protein
MHPDAMDGVLRKYGEAGRLKALNGETEISKAGSSGKDRNRHFLFLCCPRISRADILASPRTIPELVITASGQCFCAAFCNKEKSSSDILTFTWMVRFIS